MSVLTGPKILNTMIGASLGDAYLSEGNTTLRAWQALVQANVISKSLATPPSTPSNGDTYIVAAGGTGAWAGKDTKIAYWTTQNLGVAGWDFWTPSSGWIVSNQADGKTYKFNGSSWAEFGSGGLTGSYMIGPGINTPDGYISQAVTNSSITGVNNQLVVSKFDFNATLTINHVSYCGSNAFTTANIYVGLYDSSGAKILDSGAFSVNSTSGTTIQRNAVTAVTLVPATYYLAQTSDDNNSKSNVMQSGVSNTAAALFNANGSVVRYGTAANALSGGVLPATLGALTAFSTVSILIALPLFD